MTYRAPVDDILFNIFAVAPGPASPEVPAETRDDWRTILEQAAVLVEETIAPLNRAADLSASAFENGVVRTPPGWREAYATWAAAGFPCTQERHLRIRDNFSFAQVEESEIERMVRDVAAQGCDAAMIFCTNLAGAAVAARLEPELGIPVYDSVAVTLWKCLQMSGVTPASVRGWGRLFAVLGSDPMLATGD